LRRDAGDVYACLGIHLVFEGVQDIIPSWPAALCRFDLLRQRIGNALIVDQPEL
jgi:hypothetical protein